MYKVEYREYHIIDANGEMRYSSEEKSRYFDTVRKAFAFAYHLSRLYRKCKRQASIEVSKFNFYGLNFNFLFIDVMDTGDRRNVLFVTSKRSTYVIH